MMSSIKKSLLILLVVAFSVLSFGQDTLTTYYDADWKPTFSENYKYYRKAFKNADRKWQVLDYYRSGQLQMSGQYKRKKLKKKHGAFTYYYEDGTKKRSSFYKSGKLEGSYISWYESGQKKSEGKYRKGKKHGDWVSYFDNGNLDSKGHYAYGTYYGVWTWYFKNGQKSAVEEYQGSQMISEAYWNEDGSTQTPEKANVKPTYPGGQDVLMAYIANAVKYPEEAQYRGIQGRVFVGFVIDRSGKVIDVEVLRGVHPLLDAEALRVIKEMKDWIPGKQRNREVKVRYQVPINFKLNG